MENYKLKLTRSEICDLMMACTSIIADAEYEMKYDTKCPVYRRNHVLPGTIKKWQTLHDKLKKQLDVQDQKEERK